MPCGSHLGLFTWQGARSRRLVECAGSTVNAAVGNADPAINSSIVIALAASMQAGIDCEED
jgi:hypothetical protein